MMGLLPSRRSVERKAARIERKTARKIRKAEARAVKTRAKVEARFDSRSRRKDHRRELKDQYRFRAKELKAEQKAAKKEAKAAIKVSEAEAKLVAAQAQADADARPFSPARVKRFLTVARLVSPIVAPIAYRAAVAGRAQLQELQATRVGVAPQKFAEFGGYGAPLQARIAAARDSITKLASLDDGAETRSFIAAMTERLDNLKVATDAAETMAPTQRKAAFQAVDQELLAIDADLLARLGVKR